MGVTSILRCHFQVCYGRGLLQVPAPESIPSLRLHLDSQVEDVLPTFTRPAHAAALEPVSDDGLGGSLDWAAGDDQSQSAVARVLHLVPVVAEVTQFGARLTIAF